MKVKVLKEILGKIPDDYEICIDDADTGWFLDITDIEKSDDTWFVILRGCYYEENQFCENRIGMQEVYCKEDKE